MKDPILFEGVVLIQVSGQLFQGHILGITPDFIKFRDLPDSSRKQRTYFFMRQAIDYIQLKN